MPATIATVGTMLGVDPAINSPASTQQINLRAAENRFPRSFKPRSRGLKPPAPHRAEPQDTREQTKRCRDHADLIRPQHNDDDGGHDKQASQKDRNPPAKHLMKKKPRRSEGRGEVHLMKKVQQQAV
jgi:hypothetical protein